MKNGLSENELRIIRQILAPYSSRIKSVELFGSRATGRFRPNSDIDLVIKGELGEDDIDRIWTLFNESSIAVSVDINSYDLVNYPPMKEHIDKVCKMILTGEELSEKKEST